MWTHKDKIFSSFTLSTMASVSLCVRMKSWLRFWSWKERSALAANCLDKLARFFRDLPDMKTSIPPVLITFAVICFALSQGAQAVSPPPPGGYPNFTTAAGEHALQALTLGLGNTAVGTFSLFSVTTGSFNTAVGAGALDLNTADSNTAT